jgi:hypothetical protein
VKGIGGSGIKPTGKSAVIPIKPNRTHDLTLKDKTFINQTLLYRLVSDPHPLHVDPKVAAQAGYPRPIIHGNIIYKQD